MNLPLHRQQALPHVAVRCGGRFILLTSAFCLVIALQAQEAPDEPPDDVARIGSLEVRRDDFLSEVIRRHARTVLEELVTCKLVEQRAAEAGVTIPEEELEAELGRRLASIPPDQFDSYLSAQGLTREAALRQVRVDVLAQRLAAREIEVTDEEIAQVFERQKPGLGTPERRSVIWYREDSENEAHRRRAWLQGQIPEDEIEPEHVAVLRMPDDPQQAGPFDGAVFALAEAGQVTAPVQVEGGWAVARLETIIPPREATLAEYREAIRDQILEVKLRKYLPEWLKKLWDDAKIEIWIDG